MRLPVLRAALPGIVALCACLATPAFARGGNRTSLGNDLVVGQAEDIRGDVVVIGADARIEGRVRGDVVVVGGDLDLGPTARVEGDVAVAGGDYSRARGASVGGSLVGVSDPGVPAELLVDRPMGGLQGGGDDGQGRAERPPARGEGGMPGAAAAGPGRVANGGGGGPRADASGAGAGGNRIAVAHGHVREDGGDPGFFASLATPLLFCAVLLVSGLLFMSVWPERSRNLRRTLEASPWASLAMGALVSIGLGLVALLLTVTIVGILALPLLALAAFVVWLVGITGLLEALGDRLPMPEHFRSRGWDFIAGVGAFVVLALLWSWGGLGAALAFLAALVLGFMAVGAAVLSGLGRSPYGRR